MPAPVRLIRDFVNTAEPELGTDQLTGPHALATLQHIGLAPRRGRLTAADLRLLVGVREGLRAVLLDHAGHETPSPALGELDEILRTVPLTVSLGSRVVSVRSVDSRTAHHVIAAVLSAVVAAPAEDWRRLKVCSRDSCRWAFYDTSRNRSGRWCSMAGCGNIVKMRRAYRVRKNKAAATE